MVLAPALPPSSSPVPLGLEPLRLPWELRLTPEQFERVCQVNPDAVLELAADGTLIAMTPSGGEASSRNSQLLIQLASAVQGAAQPLRIFDSSGGFRVPDGSVLSPDASLLREDRWRALSPEQRRSQQHRIRQPSRPTSKTES
jgi:Uma2 family endonuclease